MNERVEEEEEKEDEEDLVLLVMGVVAASTSALLDLKDVELRRVTGLESIGGSDCEVPARAQDIGRNGKPKY